MTRITLDQLEDMFRAMSADISVDVPLLWGYFFTDPDPDKLRGVATTLETAGYNVVNLYLTDDGSTHFLHVERVEQHTPESLHARNTEFYALAEAHGLRSYDGMDVGPPASGGSPSSERPWWKFW